MLCKICQSDTSEEIIDNQTYFRCVYCGYIFTNNIPTPEQEKARYLQHNNTLENKGYVEMFEDFIALLPKKNRCLDFGSGPNPVLAELLKKQGYDVDIFDIYFAQDNSFENKKYDIITSTEVFEHLKDPVSVMEILTRILNPKGTIAIMTSFIPEDFKNWRYRKDITHIGFFTHKTMKILADMFNMEIIFLNNKNICIFKKRC